MSRRTRLLVLSAPVAVVVLVVLVTVWIVVVAGGSARTDFAERNTDALREDVAALGMVAAIAPDQYHVAAGTLAVLDDHLEDADRHFTEALSHTEAQRSCAVRVDLELVEETLGDRAAARFDGSAVGWYRRALTVAEEAPDGCFTGSTDVDPDRRAVLEVTVARLNDKIIAVSVAPPPPRPPPPAAAPSEPPPPAPAGSTPPEQDDQLRLNPGVGDPLDRLQQILRDAAAAQNGG